MVRHTTHPRTGRVTLRELRRDEPDVLDVLMSGF